MNQNDLMQKTTRSSIAKLLEILRQDRYFPLILFVLALVSFGILIPWLGLYSDDWHYFWLSYRLDYIARFFVRNRPYLGTVYDFINNILGPSQLEWHAVLFLLKWTGVTALWFTLKKAFIDQKNMAKWVCLLFAFYPGNLILFQPLVFILAVIQINLFFLSFLFSILAVQQPQRKFLFISIALLTSLLNLVASEYFFFLELLRPLFLWLVLKPSVKKPKERVQRTLFAWLPYLIIFIGALIWRFLFQATLSSHQPWVLQDLQNQPLNTLIELGKEIVKSVVHLFVSAWNNPVLLDQIYEPKKLTITLYFFGLLVLASVFLFAFFYERRKNEKEEAISQKSTSRMAVLIGLAGLLLGGLPIWLSKYSVDFGFRTENRFVIPFILGISFFLVGFTYVVFRDQLTRVFVLSLTIAFGLGFQFLTANLYRQETESLKTYYWQMQWRIPSMQTGIHFITNPPPFDMEGENSLSAGINWIYGRNEAKKQIDYYLYFNPQRIQKELGDLVKDKPLQISHQIGEFSGDQLHLLAFYYSPPACLKLLDPSLNEGSAEIPPFVSEAAVLAEPELIAPESSSLNRERLFQLFGKEPDHTWCFYYEQSELAGQFKNWAEVSALYTQVVEQRLEPAIAEEWLPFIEGLANTQDWQKAVDVSRTVTADSRSSQPLLCNLWSRILIEVKPVESNSNLAQTYYLSELNCIRK
jgi:hypothetical protein